MRPPEVFVRELSPEEGARLKQISKRARYQAKRQRAMVVLASATLMSAPEIARLMRTDESHVRKVIHAFNEEGFGSLDPDYRGGRPNKTTPCERDRIVAVARARPDTQGVPLTRWSLAKLAPHLAGMGMFLSREALRQVLIDAGLSHQRTRSWKWSPDPDFRVKAERVLALYRAKPQHGVVVCFDEMGPIQLIPHHGSGWEQRKLPRRLRATFKRPHDVRYLFGAYDVHSDRLHGRLREHKNAGEVLAFLRQIRMRYDQRLRIYLVMDNLSTHKTDAIREWAEQANVELVFTPTYASFLNRIECHFWAVGEFRRQERGLPRLGRIRQGDGRAHPLPQRTPPRPTPHPGRASTPDRRMSDRVTGATFTDDPLADAWRARYWPMLAEVNSGARPWGNFDEHHLETLDDLLTERGMDLPIEERRRLVGTWHRLDPWPDVRSGLDALRRQRVTAALSNAHVALLVDLARHADLRFDCLLSAELAHVYKPAPEVYQTAARLLGVEPAALMLVAAHPLDLRGARAAGLQTAFVDRPLEYGLGSAARDDPEADQSVGDLHELAERLAGGTYGAVSRPPGSRS